MLNKCKKFIPTDTVKMQIAKEYSLGSKDLKSVEQSWADFFIVQWDSL